MIIFDRMKPIDSFDRLCLSFKPQSTFIWKILKHICLSSNHHFPWPEKPTIVNHKRNRPPCNLAIPEYYH